jgi:PPM family protein phosphatase
LLRIAEHWHGSDLGRQRQGNEDSYFVRSPLFVVADGMGGAQAGEVASEMAVGEFARGLPQGSPADGLAQTIATANRAINDRSRSDGQLAGMGTTVTAAYVGEDEVIIAHVGDSRGYLLRDGDLIRVTRDHSLVGELVARGKLTEEQAESHPQRSVITRAVGPEPEVEVDVQAYQAKAGDVFLLCSDGLTDMVPAARVKPILEGAASLEAAGRELIAAANEAGGRDNITVILFRLEEVDGGGAADRAEAEAQDTTEYETWEGEALNGPRQGVSRAASDASEAEYRRSGTTAMSAVRPRAEPIPEAEDTGPRPRAEPAGRRRRRRRVPGALIAVVVLLLIFGAGIWGAAQAIYFVGVDERTNVVTIYRGLPYELPFGIELYDGFYSSGVTLDQVSAQRRATFTEHKLRSKDDAENLVTELERGDLQ